jgi:hypothetical protein
VDLIDQLPTPFHFGCGFNRHPEDVLPVKRN